MQRILLTAALAGTLTMGVLGAGEAAAETRNYKTCTTASAYHKSVRPGGVRTVRYNVRVNAKLCIHSTATYLGGRQKTAKTVNGASLELKFNHSGQVPMNANGFPEASPLFSFRLEGRAITWEPATRKFSMSGNENHTAWGQSNLMRLANDAGLELNRAGYKCDKRTATCKPIKTSHRVLIEDRDPFAVGGMLDPDRNARYALGLEVNADAYLNWPNGSSDHDYDTDKVSIIWDSGDPCPADCRATVKEFKPLSGPKVSNRPPLMGIPDRYIP